MNAMKIFDFDIQKGIYSFEFTDLNTESHSHPVVEIIYATKGAFTLQSNGKAKENLVFAIIGANIGHKVVSQNCTAKMLMVESHNATLSEFLISNGIILENGFFLTSSFASKGELFSEVRNLANTKDLKTPADTRVKDSIAFIEENELEYKNLISELTSKVCLSDSRLSHLFKEQVGVSIKKYLVWNKLRRAIDLYLKENTNLTDVSLQSGFFDQAHLSNSFKTILGVSPSKAYNSRILQS